MKKTLRMILCVVLVLGVFFSFSACGGSDDSGSEDSPVIKQSATGRYELVKIEWSSGPVAEDEILEELEEATGDMYVELFSDGTAQLALHGQIQDMEYSEDEMWQENFELHSYEFSVRNGKVILQKDGDKYTFVKD